MQQIIPIGEPYHDWKGRPFPIRNVGRQPTSGWTVLVSNNGGRPFNGSNNKPPRGCTNGSLGGGDNGHPAYQIPRSYVARPIGLWIRPTWNLWYTSWYHV